MSEDYLWDKSGEPDPEIERLERALGQLRFKPPANPLPLPMIARPWYRSSFLRASAVAAAAVILLLGVGLWMGLGQRTEIGSGPAPNTGPIDVTAGVNQKVDQPQIPQTPVNVPPPRIPRVARHDRRRQSTKESASAMARARNAQELARKGELAKEQLIKAMLITSDKLNTMQKKIQGTQEGQPIS